MLLSLALSGLLIELTLLLVLKFGELREQIVGAIALQLSSSVFYLIAVFFILQRRPSDPARPAVMKLILIGGLMFRVTLWPLFPAFSEDVFRYRWEGRLQASGGNPYQVRPIDPEWSMLRDQTFSRITVPDGKAGYGPMTEEVELLTYKLVTWATPDAQRQVFWFKLPGALFDLALLAALSSLLRARGLPQERLLIYAWCPLPLFEFWATGHNDSIALFFVVTALALAAKDRWNWAVFALSCAAAAKIWPAVLLPLFLRDWRFAPILKRIGVFAAGFALFALPYLSNVTENAQFMSGFVGGWRNNDFLFGFILRVIGDPYRAKYTAFAMLALVTLWVSWRRRAIEKGALIVITTMLAISANIHPWYLTWIVPLLVIYPATPLFLLTALMPLTYAVLIDWYTLHLWNGTSVIRWYIYLPVLTYTLFSLFIGRRESG